MDVKQYYEHLLQNRDFQKDPAQWRAVERLQRAYEDCVEYRAQRSHKFIRLINRPMVPRGVYLWGGVGGGKSLLMDSFYAVVPIVRKTRLHFHEFMRGVHRQMDELKSVENPIEEVARLIAKKYRLICFDEFHVSDVADAMILYNLLDALFKNGVSFVMTSNYAPDTLYPDGLHRDRIFPAIALLKDKLDIINVEASMDYRHRDLEQTDAYFTPLDEASDQALLAAYAKLSEGPDEDPNIQIESRNLKAIRRSGKLIWFDFMTLCGGPRSQYDYLEIASNYHNVILSGVPCMSAGMSSEARRFTWLIDVFYDHKVKLIMSAQAKPELLYTHGALVHEFARTVSRIVEMHSREYMETPWRAEADSVT